MIYIAICDDEENTRKYLASLIRRQAAACEIREYAGAQELLADSSHFDLIFLDVELGAGAPDGMELARGFRARAGEPQPVIIFVTGFEKYVFDAFDVEAFQYLVKPVDEQKFQDVFRRAVKRAETEKAQPARSLVVQYAGASRAIPLDAIRYAESSNHKVILHLRDEEVSYYAKISGLEEQLGDPFCRIHKGYLVNLAYVDTYTKTELTLTGGGKLLISKYKYSSFVKAYLRYLKRGLADE